MSVQNRDLKETHVELRDKNYLQHINELKNLISIKQLPFHSWRATVEEEGWWQLRQLDHEDVEISLPPSPKM